MTAGDGCAAGLSVRAAFAAPSAVGGSTAQHLTDAARNGYFKTPSRNIVCGYTVYSGSRVGKSYVGCRIKTGLEPEPPGTPRGRWTTGDVSLQATGRTTLGGTICPGDDEGDAGVFVFESRARVLAYGRAWSGGGLRCTSAAVGLRAATRVVTVSS